MNTDQDRHAAEYQRALDTIGRLLSNPPTAAGDDHVAREANREAAAALRHVRTMLYRGRSCERVIDQLAPLCPCTTDPEGDGPEQDCPIHGDGETFVMLCRWRDQVAAAAHTLRNVEVDDDAFARLDDLLDAGPWGGPDTDAAVASIPPPATIGRDELERLRAIEARAQRIVEMEPGVAPDHEPDHAVIVDRPSLVDSRVRLRALTEQVNSAAHRRLTDDADRPRHSEF